MATIYDNPNKLHAELLASNLPVVGVSSDGRIDYSRELTKTEKTAAASLIDQFDPTPSIEEARLSAYNAKGITADSLAWALWCKVINDDNSMVEAIQSVIQEIDASIH